jgi:DNA topoisomerase-1
MFLASPEIVVTHRKIRSICNDPAKSAAAANLVYVNDSMPGIRRIRKGRNFIYVSGKRKVTDEECLLRIRSLVIPPAWENVWICSQPNGHLQVTGLDKKKRKQYKYHPYWSTLRNHTKFYRICEFGECMPAIRSRIARDLAKPGLPQEKVLATVLCLMEMTSIRVGSSLYEKLYGSFGLTTLKDQHVRINGSNLRFIFRGKKGIAHNITIRSKKLAKIVKQCRDIPGKELFQYEDEEGNFRCIDSGMVNDYIQEISGSDFSAKDFRTWAGSVLALKQFKEQEKSETENGTRKTINTVLDAVAKQLGNTRTVCRKYYVHPLLISLYENNRLSDYFREDLRSRCNKFDLSCEEKLLLRILKKEGTSVTL